MTRRPNLDSLLTPHARTLSRRAAHVGYTTVHGDVQPYLVLHLPSGACHVEGALSRASAGGIEDVAFALSWRVDAVALPSWLRTRAVRALRDRVATGYEPPVNGRPPAGTLTDDASAALEELEALVNDAPTLSDGVSLWDVSDWLFHEDDEDRVRARYGITARTSDAQLVRIAAGILNEAAEDNQVLRWEALLDVLRDLRRDAS